eukprot:g4674.t1
MRRRRARSAGRGGGGRPGVVVERGRGAEGAELGGKGGNLMKCHRAGFPVPAFFVVTGAAFAMHLEENGADLDSADACRRCLLEAPLSPATVQEITRAYGRLSEEAPGGKRAAALCAVRSSSSAEDGASASFAGQMETFLGVLGVDDVLAAMRHCWASVYAERVRAYRDFAGSAGTCCVVVQLLVDARAAGVMFTANPLTGARDELVITANWGIGESVVADMTPPDTVVVGAEKGEVRSTTVASKQVMVALVQETAEKEKTVKNDARSSGCARGPMQMARATQMPVPLDKQDTLCLTPDSIHQLWELAKKVHDYYGCPQDIEWAVNQDGKVVLLQARPVTTLGQPTSSSGHESSTRQRFEPTIGEFDTLHVNETDWITTCNAQEMFPGAGTPLTISVFGAATEYAMQMLHVDFGMMPAPDPERPRLPWVSGHFFINMTNTFYMLTQMVGGTMGKANGEMSILGRINDHLTMEQLCEAAGGSPWLPRRVFNSMQYLYTIANAESRIEKMRARLTTAPMILHGDGDSDDNDVRAMYERISAFRPDYNQQWADGVMCGSTSAAWMLLVMKLVVRDRSEMWSTERVSEIAGALASAPGDGNEVESADVVKKLDEIKALISEHPDAHWFAVDLREQVSEAHAWIARSGTAGPIIRDAFAQLLERHGHRCVKEAEFRNEDWGESPEILIRLLQSGVAAILKARSHASAKVTQDMPEKKERRDRFEMLLRNEWSHVGCLWRPLLRFAVAKAREGVARRELGKSLQVQLHSHLKRAFRRLGRALVKKNILPEVDLMYFLSFEELGVLCGVTSTEEYKSADEGELRMRSIKRRRLFPSQERLRFADLVQGKPEALPREMDVKAGQNGFSVVGTPVSQGSCEGYARVVRTLQEAANLEPGEILICPFTDVGWTPYFSLAAGLVTEIGGLLSHGAVVAREYGLPCVVNIKNACDRFQTGSFIRIEGNTGSVIVLEDPA